MDIQNQNLRCSCKQRCCTARLQTTFERWVSHCIRIGLRDEVQCTKSCSAVEATLWGSCSGFCRAEVQMVTEIFLVRLRWKHGFDLTKPCLSKTKTTSCTYSDQVAKYHSSSKEGKSLALFSPPKKIIYKGKKLLHIVSEERRSSIWSWPLSVREGVCETFQLQNVWAWNQMVVWGRLSLLSQSCFMGQCEM